MLGMSDRTGGNGADGRPGRRARANPRPRYWAQARAENPRARFVPFSSLVSPHDVITRGGDYLRVWRLDGLAFECADEHQIGERHEALCSLLRNLAGGQWAVCSHRLHRVVSDSLKDPVQPGFARDLCRLGLNEIYGRINGLLGDLRTLAHDETDYKGLIARANDTAEKLVLAQGLATRRLASGVVPELDACFAALALEPALA